MPTVSEIATILTVEMLRKSGVQAWQVEPELRQQITTAAIEMAVALAENDMALPDSFLVVEANCITFADHANDFSPTAANSHEHGTPTDVAMQLASVGNGAARQSAKVDLGANRYEMYGLSAAIELAATPTAGNTIDFYWAPSPSGTAGTANPGGVSGANAAYAGYSSNLVPSLKQLQYIGSLVCTVQATGTVQQQLECGLLVPTQRYGSLVVVNNSGAAIHSDDVECHVVLHPIGRQIQD